MILSMNSIENVYQTTCVKINPRNWSLFRIYTNYYWFKLSLSERKLFIRSGRYVKALPPEQLYTIHLSLHFMLRLIRLLSLFSFILIDPSLVAYILYIIMYLRKNSESSFTKISHKIEFEWTDITTIVCIRGS